MVRLAILLFTLLSALDTTIFSTLLPHAIASFGQMELYPILTSSYFVSFLLATPIVGKTVDHFGTKMVGLISLLLFLLGTSFATLSPSMEFFILARFFEGLGAAGLVNVSNIAIAKLYHSDSHRSFMQAMLSLMWALASLTGPFLASYLATVGLWRLAFAINIPLALIALGGWWKMTEIHQKPFVRFDHLSVWLFSATVLVFFLNSLKVAQNGFYWTNALVIAIALLALIVLIVRSLKVESPLLPLRHLKSPVTILIIVAGLVTGIAMTMTHSQLALLGKGALSFSQTQIGLLITIVSLGWTGGSFLASFLVHRLELNKVFHLGLLLLTVGFALLSSITAVPTFFFIIFSVAIQGIALGLLINVTIVSIQRTGQGPFLGRLTAFLSLTRSFGASLGAASAGFLQLYFFHSSLEKMAPFGEKALFLAHPEKMLEKPVLEKLSPDISEGLRSLFGHSIEQLFVLAAIVLAILFFISLKISVKKTIK